MDFYEKMGLSTIINASETYTGLGGSLMDVRTLEAMQQAGRAFVDIGQLIQKVGEYAAELTQNEAAHITTGASGGLVLSAAACLCGNSEEQLSRLPDTVGIQRDEILLFDGSYLDLIPYWKLIGLTGAKIRKVEPTMEAAVAALNEKTAAFCLFPGKLYETDVPACEQAIPILKQAGCTVVVDAAAQLPPVSNLWHYTCELGADLCIFSGGKHLRGPQSTGLIVGRKALVDMCRLAGCPNAYIGRPYKTGKEELAGFITALEIFVKEGGQPLYERQEKQLERLAMLLQRGGVKDIVCLKEGRLGTEQPLLHVLLPKGTGKELNAYTRKLPQPIDVGVYGDEFGMPENLIFLNAYNLWDDELEAVANAVIAYCKEDGANGTD